MPAHTTPPDAPLRVTIGTVTATLPMDRGYTRSHLWTLPAAGGFRVGLTDYAAQLLGDIYLLEWTIAPHVPVKAGQVLGQLETSHGLVPLHAPSIGRVSDFNIPLLEEPDRISSEPYGLGWLFHFSTEAGFHDAREYARWLSEPNISQQNIPRRDAAGRTP